MLTVLYYKWMIPCVYWLSTTCFSCYHIRPGTMLLTPGQLKTQHVWMIFKTQNNIITKVIMCITHMYMVGILGYQPSHSHAWWHVRVEPFQNHIVFTPVTITKHNLIRQKCMPRNTR
jgi:hypothetical protein